MEDITELREQLKTKGLALIKYDDGPVHSFPYDTPWLDDAKFSGLYEKVRQNTLVDRVRCYSLYLLAHQVLGVPGDFLEVGTWRGGTAAMLASVAPEKHVFVADTFRGVVKSSEWEHYEDAAHDDTSEETVRSLFADMRITNCEILVGIFPEDTGSAVQGRPLSLVYLDVDVYQSTKDAFNFVWDNVSPGGIVVFDDYGFTAACGGIKRFVDEISGDRDKVVVTNLCGSACVIKV